MLQGLTAEISQVMPAARATGLFDSLFTAMQPNGTLGPSGAPDNTFTSVPALVNIPCMNTPMSTARIEADESKAVGEILSKTPHHVLLNGYYSTLIGRAAQGWRCVIDGITYDLLGVETDSQKQMTLCAVVLTLL